MSISRPVAPRDYAAAILAEPSFDRRQHRAGRAEQAREKPQAAPRREARNSVIHHTCSAPEVGNAAIARLRAVIGKGAA